MLQGFQVYFFKNSGNQGTESTYQAVQPIQPTQAKLVVPPSWQILCSNFQDLEKNIFEILAAYPLTLCQATFCYMIFHLIPPKHTVVIFRLELCTGCCKFGGIKICFSPLISFDCGYFNDDVQVLKYALLCDKHHQSSVARRSMIKAKLKDSSLRTLKISLG